MLLIDEAQGGLPAVLSELRILSSANFDSQNVLTVCLVGDERLPDKLRTPDLLPLATRVKTRLTLSYATPDELRAFLVHALGEAGCPHLMTPKLITTLCERAAGNLRVLCNTASELLAHGAKRELRQLDEKLYLELFDAPRPSQPANSKSPQRLMATGAERVPARLAESHQFARKNCHQISWFPSGSWLQNA